VHSRGVDPQGEAFFFLHELEAIAREWVATVYHCRPHDGLVDPHVPGLRLSPAAMFEHGVARAGYIEVPRDPDLAYEFLAVRWRTIQHYGVDVDRRRYNGACLNPFRNVRSPYTGQQAGKWPIHVDPDDVTRAYFRSPDDRRWYTLWWEHAPAVTMPLSEDALTFARKLAAARYRYPDDRLAVADLLERWNLGLGTTLAERRMALRLSREQTALDVPADSDDVTTLPSVRKVLDAPADSPLPQTAEAMPDEGDDDSADDLDDFYTDALEDV
jgi:hypothetical protein